MEDWTKALAAINAIYSLLDSDAATLEQDFDSVTQEHVIRLEYRRREHPKSNRATKNGDRIEYIPILKSLLDSA